MIKILTFNNINDQKLIRDWNFLYRKTTDHNQQKHFFSFLNYDINKIWLDIYKEKEAWETCLGLLKVRERISLTNLIESKSLRGNSKKWAIKIETLHTYVPSSLKIEKLNDPMWE